MGLRWSPLKDRDRQGIEARACEARVNPLTQGLTQGTQSAGARRAVSRVGRARPRRGGGYASGGRDGARGAARRATGLPEPARSRGRRARSVHGRPAGGACWPGRQAPQGAAGRNGDGRARLLRVGRTYVVPLRGRLRLPVRSLHVQRNRRLTARVRRSKRTSRAPVHRPKPGCCALAGPVRGLWNPSRDATAVRRCPACPQAPLPGREHRRRSEKRPREASHRPPVWREGRSLRRMAAR